MNDKPARSYGVQDRNGGNLEASFDLAQVVGGDADEASDDILSSVAAGLTVVPACRARATPRPPGRNPPTSTQT